MRTTSIILLSILLLSQAGCKCFGEECNMTINKKLYISVRNPQTGQLDNVLLLPFHVTVNGADWKRGEISGDSLQYWYDPLESAFSQTGDYEGIITLDGQEKCRLRWTLRTTPCCEHLPQYGSVSLQSGMAEIKDSSLVYAADGVMLYFSN